MANLSLKKEDSHFENVLAYYLDDKTPEEKKFAKLSKLEKELKKRWETAWTCMLEFRSREDAVKKLVRLFGVSKPTAYRDVQRTEMLFGSFKKLDKEAWRYIQIERKHQYLQLALRKGDLELVYKFDKAIDDLLGLDKEESPVNLEKLQSNSYEIIMSNKQQRLIKKILESSEGVVNMNLNDAVDTNFEEVDEESEEK